MRVRLPSDAAASSLVAAFEAAGGTAHLTGDTVELVHPSGESARYDNCELEFFVRAWAIGERSAPIAQPSSDS